MKHYYHGSNKEICEIIDNGMFGGIFAAADEQDALSHGKILHAIEIEEEKHLTDFVLNYKIDNALEVALKICNNDEELAECIMDINCPVPSTMDATDIESGWEVQRLRGVLASELGYKSVEMRDEHGTTVLCLPGCSIAKI